MSSTSGTITVGNTTNITASNTTGKVSCSSNNTNVATCSISGNTLTIKGISAGNATITVNVEAATNYNRASKTYSITVSNPIYSNGTAIYYNPETNTKCSSSEAVSTTGTKTGCMKWYTFNDNEYSSTVNMILDHNTTAFVAYNSTGDNTSMKEVKVALESDTESWNKSINPRLITADEIAQITNNTSFDAATSNDEYYFDSKDQTIPVEGKGNSQYAWLFDYTYKCIDYGCNIADSNSYYTNGLDGASIFGYWTSTPIAYSDDEIWSVWRDGSVGLVTCNVEDTVGIRPVITVSKDIIN